MAGYSSTPLPAKLGIKADARVVLIGAPGMFERTLGALPPGVELGDSLLGRTPPDVVLLFVTRRALLQRRLPQVRGRMAPHTAFWVAWPKQASGVATDVTEDTVRGIALPTGLVDVKVCAIDTTWSGLKLVIRRELRD